MKIAVTIIRILFGALFVFASVVVLFNIQMGPPPVMPEKAGAFMGAMMSTGYLMTVVKVTELICGILLIVNFFAPLALVVLFPITVNIVLFHAILTEPKDLPMSIVVLLAHVFLAYTYRKNYSGLFLAKPIQGKNEH